MTAENVVSQLHTNAACGLTRKAARSRYRKFGANTLFGTQKNNRGAFWLSVLRDPSILLLAFILFFACCFSVQAPVLAAVAVTLVVVALTFFLMRKSNAADEIVSLYSIPTVFVLREGKVMELSAQYLVPGDILLLQKGDIVPCDCRILEENGDFCTRLIYRDANGRRTAVEQIKKTDTVYPLGTSFSRTVHFPVLSVVFQL
jgi:Ca2+-transporting ATPase